MRPDLFALPIWLVGSMALAGADPQIPRFLDRTGTVRHDYSGGWEHFVGGGVAAFDCDGDRFLDLFVAGGAGASVLLRNRTKGAGGDLSFVAATPDDLALTGVVGAYPLDIDSDGFLDLAILRVGQNQLLKGGPDCSFAAFTDLGFQSTDRWTTAFSAIWEAGQYLPTMVFGNYVDRSDPGGPFEACAPHALFRPEQRRYGAPTELEPGYCALSMLFSDWGRRGRADLRVSNDRHYYVRGGQEQLWAMTAPPALYGAEDGWRSFKIWGMGIASRDITSDGIPEIYLSSMGDQKLQSLEPGAVGPSYADATFDRGTTAHRPYFGDDGRPSTGWHVAFGDVQNDGRDDIFVSKGNVDQMPTSAMEDPNNLLLQNAGGQFSEAGLRAGVASVRRGRGAALADLNLDGLLDLVVVNRRAPMEIYQNVGPSTGNWLQVALVQPAPNVNAVGAWIEIDTGDRVIAREVTVGGGHASGTAAPEHFGLGGTERVRLRVLWPDGRTSDWAETAAGAMISVTRADPGLVIERY